MKSVPAINKESTNQEASDWLRKIIGEIGPCFHFDTPPEDYYQADGKPLLSEKEQEDLAQGLCISLAILGQDLFENICFQSVLSQLGTRYDEKLNELVAALG
ncbi:MAG: hypothetical protein KJ050_15620 [Candidatus Omnitrophica bacterium]|nr:hypothetical protein [Candidatus Omnitrophota bacterium]